MTDVRVDRIGATVIGFLADTHVKQDDGGDLPPEVAEAFEARGVQLIVHIGHYGKAGLLTRLAQSAPVLATTTALDNRLSAEALTTTHKDQVAGEARVLEAGPLRIGVTFDLSGKGFDTQPDDPPIVLDGRPLAEILGQKFGGQVDVVAYANTHIDRVTYAQGVLMFNPGSPNLPGGDRKGGLGTIAVLNIDGGLARLEIVDLERVRRTKAAAADG